jgi:hypothetical protein
MAATIEGKPASEWFKDAAQRQKRSNAYAKYEEPAKPEPARQTASMPKPASHASPSTQPKQAAMTKPSRVMPKPESYSMKGNRWPGRGLKYNRWDGLVPMGGDVIRPNRGYAQGSIETPNSEPAKPSRPAPGQAKGTEAEWTAKRDAAKQAGRVRSIVRRSEDEGRSSLHRLQAEARAKSSADSSRKRQRESDEWEAKNALEKVGDATVKYIEKPAMKTAVAGGKAAVAVGSAAAGYLSRAGRWLGGDSDARRRLQSAK